MQKKVGRRLMEQVPKFWNTYTVSSVFLAIFCQITFLTPSHSLMLSQVSAFTKNTELWRTVLWNFQCNHTKKVINLKKKEKKDFSLLVPNWNDSPVHSIKGNLGQIGIYQCRFYFQHCTIPMLKFLLCSLVFHYLNKIALFICTV